jgi:hypothetical protein
MSKIEKQDLRELRSYSIFDESSKFKLNLDKKHLDEPNQIEFLSSGRIKESYGISVYNEAKDGFTPFNQLEEFDPSYLLMMKKNARIRQKLDKQSNLIFQKRKNCLKRNMRKRR